MTLWISHRGICEGKTVENTIASFDAAVRKGFTTLETDIRITADHHLVLCHDDSFARLSKNDVELVKMPRSIVEKIELADGQKPLFFEDFAAKYSQCSWVLDIKPETSAAALRILHKKFGDSEQLAKFVKKASFVVWSSEDLEFIEESFPGAKIYATKGECWRAGLSCAYLTGIGSGILPGKTYSLTPKLFGQNLFNSKIVQRYHDLGAKVLAFLPQSIQEFDEAFDAGFDEILSDGTLLKRKRKS